MPQVPAQTPCPPSTPAPIPSPLTTLPHPACVYLPSQVPPDTSTAPPHSWKPCLDPQPPTCQLYSLPFAAELSMHTLRMPTLGRVLMLGPCQQPAVDLPSCSSHCHGAPAYTAHTPLPSRSCFLGTRIFPTLVAKSPPCPSHWHWDPTHFGNWHRRPGAPLTPPVYSQLLTLSPSCWPSQ